MQFEVRTKKNFKFNELEPILVGSMEEGMKRLQGSSLKALRQSGLTPRSRKLERSLKRGGPGNIWKLKKKMGRVTGKYGTKVFYARFHEYGAFIRASKKKYLTFTVGGEWKKVEQVRLRARPFLEVARRRSEDWIVKRFVDNLWKKLITVR